MSRRGHHAAIQEIRSWTTEHVQKVLSNRGLGDCCEAVKKREVDGDMLLTLTEGQLALWKRDLSLSTSKKLARFVEDVAAQPEKYVQPPELQADINKVVEHKALPAVTRLVSNHSGRSSPLSDTASWDTDFSDDQALSPTRPTDVEYMNSEDVSEKPPGDSETCLDVLEVEYSNNERDKPPVPTRPPNLSACNLPKPPVPLESNCYGHVKSLVSNLNLQDPSDQYDEEEYESLDGNIQPPNLDVLASMLKKSLQEREQATQPHRASMDLVSGQNTQDNEGYTSDEYESIKDSDKPPVLPPGEGAEYYLQPLAPALPVKPGKKPADPGVPSSKPPSPPRRKSDDSSSSPGNSGDGVVGLFGELIRKIRGPSDFRERTPTLDTKKAAAGPNKAEPRPMTFQTSQRPLPPTPEDKKPASAASRRLSKAGLTQQPWYHNVDRRRGEELLRNGEDGSFLIRPSNQAHNAHTLTLWYNNRLFYIGIRLRADGRYALGTEKANEQSFASVEELVQNYRSEKLVLYSGGEKAGRTLLTSSPAQDSQPPAL